MVNPAGTMKPAGGVGGVESEGRIWFVCYSVAHLSQTNHAKEIPRYTAFQTKPMVREPNQ
jgi:hypothetical protein